MLWHFLAKSASDAVSSGRAVRGEIEQLGPDEPHLAAAAAWLMRSIDVCGGNASSKGYRFMRGWMPPYPETSGYIIPTLLTLGEELGQAEYQTAAHRLGSWLVSIQRSDGGFTGREVGVQDAPDVFDTGMILLGFNALIVTGHEEEFEAPAARACEFLVSSLNDQGCFYRNISHDILHTYNVRSAWALLAFGKLNANVRYQNAAISNVDWTLKQQTQNGFFLNNEFKPGGNANTHGIAYVMRGLLQCYDLSGRADVLDAVIATADALAGKFDQEGWIAAELGPEWEYRSSHICLTGYVQTAIVFYRLALLTGETRYAAIAERLVAAVANTQDTENPDAPHCGAIAGSFPFHGAYAPLQYPNWATKFFIDALLIRRRYAEGRCNTQSYELYSG